MCQRCVCQMLLLKHFLSIFSILLVEQISSYLLQINVFLAKHFLKDPIFDSSNLECQFFGIEIEEPLSVLIDGFGPTFTSILGAKRHESPVIVR